MTSLGKRALSSAGRASRLHREGREFEPLSAHQYKPPARAVFCFWLNRGLNSREGSSTTSERQTRVCRSASPMSAGADKLFIKKRRSALAPFRRGVNAFAAEKDYYMRKKHTKCIFFVKCL